AGLLRDPVPARSARRRAARDAARVRRPASVPEPPQEPRRRRPVDRLDGARRGHDDIRRPRDALPRRSRRGPCARALRGHGGRRRARRGQRVGGARRGGAHAARRRRPLDRRRESPEPRPRRARDAHASARRSLSRPRMARPRAPVGPHPPPDPRNPPMARGPRQIAELREAFGVAPGEEWAGFDPASAEAAYVRGLPPLWTAPRRAAAPSVPTNLDETYEGAMSTQEAF